VTGTLNLDAFGNLAGSTGSSSNPYMYCGAFGYRNDADAGLALVGARYYDYQVGRFVTRDTILSEQPYTYCEDDPVNAVDPSGHQEDPNGWWPLIKRIIGSIFIDPRGSKVGTAVRAVIVYVIVGAILAKAIGDLGDYLKNHGNDQDGFGSGHGGPKSGPGDFNHMMDKWERGP
jgi:RHS repeat-associated protein